MLAVVAGSPPAPSRWRLADVAFGSSPAPPPPPSMLLGMLAWLAGVRLLPVRQPLCGFRCCTCWGRPLPNTTDTTFCLPYPALPCACLPRPALGARQPGCAGPGGVLCLHRRHPVLPHLQLDRPGDYEPPHPENADHVQRKGACGGQGCGVGGGGGGGGGGVAGPCAGWR